MSNVCKLCGLTARQVNMHWNFNRNRHACADKWFKAGYTFDLPSNKLKITRSTVKDCLLLEHFDANGQGDSFYTAGLDAARAIFLSPRNIWPLR